jgi:GNAT superfamily N-acetyltransferase
MIRLVESPDQLGFLGETPFGCRIRSLASAYGVGENFARFWVQNGIAAIAKIDDAAVLEDFGSDWDELREFLSVLDIKALTCAEAAAGRLGFPIARRGEIMTLGAEVSGVEVPVENDPGLREIYALLCTCCGPNFPVPEFEPFYMDMSYRLRHGAGAAVGVKRDGALVSCALCSSLTERAAVASTVATKPEYRRSGLGRTALLALAARLHREHLYLFRADGENEEFYRGMGFRPYGRWAELKI